MLTITLILVLCAKSQGEAPVFNQITRFTASRTVPNGNTYRFEADMTALVGLVGAPSSPFYSYFIDFGDGHVEQGHLRPNELHLEVFHTYAIDNNQPLFHIALKMYNIYSKGNPPPEERIAPSSVPITATTGVSISHTPIIQGNGIPAKLKPGYIPYNFNRHGHYLIEPDDSLSFTVAYENITNNALINGKVVLMFNENSLDPCFQNLNNTRTYHNERVRGNVNNSLLPAMRNYRNRIVWEVTDVVRGEEQQFFVDLGVLELEETVTTSLAVAFIPDNSRTAIVPNVLPMTIMRSRDPNSIDGAYNENILGKGKYSYSVDFLNESDGPEREITIKCWDHRANWDVESFELTAVKIGRDDVVTDEKKLASISEILPSDNDTITIKLTGIYLNGVESVQVESPEEALGYIKYDIRPKKKWKTTKAQTYIQFGNQEPVFTNKKKIFTQKRFILGIEGVMGLDEIGFNNWEANSDLPLNDFFNYSIRGRVGYQLTDRYAAITEIGYNTSQFTEVNDLPDTLKPTLINHDFVLNPQLSIRLHNRVRAGIGANLKWRNEVTEINQQATNSIWLDFQDRSNWLIDAQFTILDTRFIDLNLGARYYVPLDFRNRGQGAIYTALRFNL